MKKTVKKSMVKAPVKKTIAKKPMMKTGGTKKSLTKAQYGNMTDAQKKKASEAMLKTQNKEYIQAGERLYAANKDGRVSMVDYVGKSKPFYTKTIDTTGLAKGRKNFELERDIDRGEGYNPSFTPITKTEALKTVNNWKNEMNKSKVAANKVKVQQNANKVSANAAKYQKKGGMIKKTTTKIIVKSKKK